VFGSTDVAFSENGQRAMNSRPTRRQTVRKSARDVKTGRFPAKMAAPKGFSHSLALQPTAY
ncbi:MAG: hypothetical protein ACRDGG_05680, partial [Anaerolineae bacterium]